MTLAYLYQLGIVAFNYKSSNYILDELLLSGSSAKRFLYGKIIAVIKRFHCRGT